MEDEYGCLDEEEPDGRDEYSSSGGEAQDSDDKETVERPPDEKTLPTRKTYEDFAENLLPTDKQYQALFPKQTEIENRTSYKDHETEIELLKM